MTNSKLSSCAIEFVSADIEKAANYYRDILGFRVVEYYNRQEKFVALYRDSVEIVLVQSQFGTVKSNRINHGAGYDAYLVPENPEAVEAFYSEIQARGAKIPQVPTVTSYGSLEFVFEDIDGRLIGVGRIKDDETFFGKVG